MEKINQKEILNKNNFKVVTPINDFLTLCRSHKTPYIVNIRGKKIYVHPKIMSPKYSYAPQFFMDHWNINKNDSVLEIGTGSGILAIFASEIAKKVVASDLNPYCIESVKKTIELNKSNIELRIGNMFDVVKKDEKFTKILFNAPYFNQKPKDELELGVFDEDYKAMYSFLSGFRKHLNKEGIGLVGFSELGDVKRIEEMMSSLKIKIIDKKKETYGHTRILYYLR